MKPITVIIMILAAQMLQSCQKDFLDKKPDQKLLVPSILADFRALLDNIAEINQMPYLPEVSAGDIYTTDAGWQGADPLIRNSYLWAEDLYEGNTVADWNRPYLQVFYSNIVLDGLDKFSGTAAEAELRNEIHGAALFTRSLALYNLSQSFAAPYDKNTAANLPGIPLRLSADINKTSVRGTLQQTYDQLIDDLLKSAELLPLKAAIKSRPSRHAAFALLARIYLSMEDYTMAGTYADAALKISSELIDYNSLQASASRPFPRTLLGTNDEVIYYSQLISVSFLTTSTLTRIDTTLFRNYHANDLRKTIFFTEKGKDLANFKGTYSGDNALFSGLANDEVFLIRAEAAARSGDAVKAMADLNALLIKRWKKGSFVTLKAANAEEALALVLRERRKELVLRGLRWTDVRRLNKDPRFQIEQKRLIGGQLIVLPPGDPRYVFPIPEDEIRNSGIEQNPR